MLAGLAEAATPGFGYGLLMGMLVSLLMSYLARLSMPMRTAGRRPAPGSQKVNGTDVASQYARPAASTPTVEPCPCSAAAEPPPALQRARAPTAEDRAAEPARRAVRLESAAIERLDRPPQLKVPCVPEAHEFEANDFVHSPLPLGLPDSAQPSEALRDAFGALLPMWSSEMGSAHFSSQPRAQQHGGDECGSAPQSGAPISSPRSMPPSSSSSPLKRRAGAAAPQPLPYTVASVPRRLDATSSKSLITARSAFAASSRAPSTTSEEAATGRPHSGGTLRRRVPAMSLARSRRSETPPANSSSCTGASDTIHLGSMHNVFSSPNLSALGHGERRAQSPFSTIATTDSYSSSIDEAELTTFDAATSDVTGFLVDLDGTVYRPGSLLPGSRAFLAWYVFLSNTGSKCSEECRKKLQSPPYQLDPQPLPHDTIYTAAEAQIAYLQENVPRGSKLFVVSGGGDFWLGELRKGHEELVASWEIRTSLSDAEAKQWATIAAAHQRESKVWVCFFHDGTISAMRDPKTGTPGCSDWSFELIRILSLLVAHRAELVYTADDAFNPLLDDEYSGYVWPSPGPGMFAEMLKKIMYPLGRDKVHWARREIEAARPLRAAYPAGARMVP
ncbi:hypothetical protein EMIHUDRAFT_229032 [Emiliania huxleyi CCMP1516]|uniref:LNS2/PITP domain-containing protein n=2 Tax=Emiliania huxleyi TaxID=2903 RepID=A0A0D3KDV5_EMIH1|nr:hypothetical protein EMIHUDRAFT_229032 [Emiliania huxleyi CCMP1516]EOD33940.1 hypothetical protein EMIHUDRAFT_229032 [Emiliania huxleyi CCMP1516]|eukprot:XP_005786369.1 hypothetical protein EMIHUDRAFT_229032 [Emiliania huxleyi CCMP1516]